MVLVIMVGFLIERIYIVIQPQTTDNIPIRPPKQRVDPSLLPGDPPPPPRIRQELDPSPLWDFDPFQWNPLGQRGPAGGALDRPPVKILRFAPSPTGGTRVQLQSESKAWFDEGDEFEIYKILEINQDEGYVLLHDSSTGEPIRIVKD